MSKPIAKCPVCGKEIEQKVGRGRPREYHDSCRLFRNAMDEAMRALEGIDFEPTGEAARRLGRELYQGVNALHQHYMAAKRKAAAARTPEQEAARAKRKAAERAAMGYTALRA